MTEAIPENNKLIESESLNREFREASHEKVKMWAIHATKLHNLPLILNEGLIRSGSELGEVVHMHNRDRRKISIIEPDISMTVGLPSRIYTDERAQSVYTEDNWRGGVAFLFNPEELSSVHSVKIKYGGFVTYQELHAYAQDHELPGSYRKYLQFDKDEFNKMEMVPEDMNQLIDFAQLARMAGKLNTSRSDEGEIGISGPGETPPEVPISEGVLCLPKHRRPELLRYLGGAIKRHDLSIKDPESLIALAPNVYWYSQRNLEDAVKYLSLHAEEIKKV